MNVDFHSHFLPGIDDGARDADESLAILRYLKSAGIETVFATPHYSINHESVDEFLARRTRAYERLLSHIEMNGVRSDEIPRIFLGAEVALYPSLSEAEGIRKLCLGNSNHILLELPMRKYEKWENEELYNVMYQFGVTPVMAHINRYRKIFSSYDFDEIFLNGDVILQINCEVTSDFAGFGKVKKYIKGDFRTVFGCDIHRMELISECGLEKMKKYSERLSPVRKKEISFTEKNIVGDPSLNSD